MNKIALCFFLGSFAGCGVKGPPEPPLPTEASLQKEQKQKDKKKQQDSASEDASQATKGQ